MFMELDMIMRSLITSLKTLRGIIDLFVYLSVTLGLLLLLQTYDILPLFVFRIITIGWSAYLLVAIAVARGNKFAYPGVMVLALLTLLVSLPQRTHYSLSESGQLLGAFTFLTGSILQISLLVMIPIYLRRKSKE